VGPSVAFYVISAPLSSRWQSRAQVLLVQLNGKHSLKFTVIGAYQQVDKRRNPDMLRAWSNPFCRYVLSRSSSQGPLGVTRCLNELFNSIRVLPSGYGGCGTEQRVQRVWNCQTREAGERCKYCGGYRKHEVSLRRSECYISNLVSSFIGWWSWHPYFLKWLIAPQH